MALTPQLSPTDFASLERIEDREARDKAYAESAIYRHDLPQGTRYTKGTSASAEKRSWQSLDAILRSDAAAFEALPHRKLRVARLFTALGVATSLVTVAGIAASAREGLDLQRLDGTGAILLGGGLASVAFAITAGVLFTRARKDYDRAVDVYNDSLGVRLGLYTADGKYIPPRGALVDKDGYILLDDAERVEEPAPETQPDAPPADAPAADAPPADAPPADAPPADAPAAEASPEVPPPAVPVLRPSGAPGAGATAAIRLQMR
jgi:catechol 2,3-dioxygenase-like lactoylglutathione lyase family enzyme